MRSTRGCRELIASHLGVRRYEAPMVFEGGSFFVDGEGTMITTEQCLLHENRNPSMSRDQIESTLHDHLGIDKVVWLGEGHYEDFSTDGHVDDIAHFLVAGPGDPAHAVEPGPPRPRQGRRERPTAA